MKTLYEDNHLIAVYKPAGVLTQSDKPDGNSLFEQVKKYLKEKYHKPGRVFLGLVQRLDRPVSGIVLFGKTSKGAGRLARQFRERTIEKTYQALVVGQPREKQGIIRSRLKKEARRRRTEIDPAGREAELSYRLLRSGKYSLLEIRPKTGRSHQIRAQLASIGLPILGDVKYGAPFPLPDRSIALAATKIRFETAVGKEIKEISIGIPEEWRAIFSGEIPARKL
jgi:23S rRNA pseudouridine1911/1915/1917 synthase